MRNFFLFNSDNEMAIANGNISYTPPVAIVKMMQDLSFLPAHYAEQGDYVLLDSPLDANFRRKFDTFTGVGDLGVCWEKAQVLSLNELRPWGWSPRVHGLLEKLKVNCSKTFLQSVMGEWQSGREEWYSRKKVIEYLHILKGYTNFSEELFPTVCCSMDELKLSVKRGDVVLKSPWSSSGRGILMLKKGDINAKTEEWLTGILRRQKYVMIEKWLDRVSDFAMEFEIDGKGVARFLGFSDFYTGEGGEYKGNYAGDQRMIEKRLGAYVGEERIHSLKDSMSRSVEQLYGGNYIGCLGVDMMIYRDFEGSFQVHPCVEINLRYNMGIVALSISERYLSEGSEGMYQVQCFKRRGEAYRADTENRRLYPLVIEAGKIVSGYLPLTPVYEDTIFVANVVIDRSKI